MAVRHLKLTLFGTDGAQAIVRTSGIKIEVNFNWERGVAMFTVRHTDPDHIEQIMAVGSHAFEITDKAVE